MPTYTDPNKPVQAPGIAGPVAPEGDDLDAMLAELGLSSEEVSRLAQKQARLNAQGRPEDKPVGQLANGHTFFDPGGIAQNLLAQYQYRKDQKTTDADSVAAREKATAARAKVAAHIPGIDDATAARISATTTDEGVLNALQLIRQRNAEERGNTREDKIRAEQAAQRAADKTADREYETTTRNSTRAFRKSEGALDREQRRALLAQELEAQTGKAQQAAGAEAAKAAKSANSAYSTWQQAATQLSNSFRNLGSGTGTIEGLIPAMGEESRAVESDRANLAPVLKQLFRQAGEGSFSDSDQKLLMNMVPTRQDSPRAADEKLRKIDSIVQQKLGMAQQAQSPAGAGPTFTAPNTKGGVSDASPDGWRISIKPRGNT